MGYHTVRLIKDGASKTYKVHRLVAQAFIPNPDGKKEVNHLNAIRNDNRLENLEWATRQENNAYSAKLQKERWDKYKKAYDLTVGQFINPEAVKDLLDATEMLYRLANAALGSTSYKNADETLAFAKAAIEKAKL